MKNLENFNINAADTLLLIIDIQDKLAAVMSEKDRVVKATKILIETARTMDMPIISTRQYPKGLGDLMECLELRDDGKVFDKETFTSVTPELKEELEKLNKKNILIVGMETHICVLQTCRDLIKLGYNPIIVEEGVCSRTIENKNNGLRLMERMGAITSNVETVLFDILKRSGTEEFKKLSKLIK